VVAAAVILRRGDGGYRDSKTIDPAERERLAERIRATAVAWSVGVAEADEIDQINVLEATRRAAIRAVEGLACRAGALVTDYLALDVPVPVVAVAKGDATSCSIAAASILAKTTRDALMRTFDTTYPGFGFASNKGYGSPLHLEALRAQGVSPIHRRTFRPVAQVRLFP
jgi:ribonuclease HII